MGTSKRRQTKRNESRPAALSFLSNITLGNENEANKSPLKPLESTTTHQHGPSFTAYGALSFSSDNDTEKGSVSLFFFKYFDLLYG